MNFSEIKCFYCNKNINRLNKEINRSKKLGRRIYCSLNCSGKKNVGHLKEYNDIDKKVLWNKGLILTDDKSPFRALVTRVRSRANRRKDFDFNLDVEFVENLWKNQKGVCPYTGMKMILPQTSKNSIKIKRQNIFQASLDRIDCSKGYVKGNIQIISLMANISKNSFPDELFLEFCKKVVLKNSEKNIFCNYKNNYNIESFQKFIKLAKQRGKEKNIPDYYKGLTIEYLQSLWIKQCGKCPYTGWDLDLPKTSNDWNNYLFHIKRASLDRIDNSKGYIPGNVQFVCVIYNYTKGIFTDEEVQIFCKAVYNHRFS